jgi:hypothetical protein
MVGICNGVVRQLVTFTVYAACIQYMQHGML